VRTGRAAQVTVQDYFFRYPHLAGMTGTALDAARELRKVYRCRVVRIPTNRPSQRRELPQLVFGTADAKWAAIVDEVRRVHALGRPVLIGTRSIEKSVLLSRLLTQSAIEHQVLNAYHLAEEADIVAQAGIPGRVTVSTNMAGRGTDIKLGDGVAQIGGLHVIGTEMHDSSRIDRQLSGRCGRQGDPGTYRQYLALDDELLLLGLGPDGSHKCRESGKRSADRPLEGYGRVFRKAQKKVAARHSRDRRALLYFGKGRAKTDRQMGRDPYLDTPGS
jgi:preprotein translocase subunit SecA